MKDILGKLKQLKHIEPDKAYLKYSQKRLFAHINSPSHVDISLYTLASSLSLCGLLVFFAFRNATPIPTPLASLDTTTLTQEFNEINLKPKIAEVKTRDSKNRAIDRAIQNLAYTGNSTTKAPVISQTNNDKVNQLLDELL